MKNFYRITVFCCIATLPVTAVGDDAFPWNNYLPAILSGSAVPPPSPPAYTRSSSGNIVTDTKTHLMWQDYYLRFKETEADGIAYCEEMLLDGYDDWRFPDFSELQNLFKGVDADPDFDLRYWGSFSKCTAAIAIGGYIKTPYGAEKYGGNTGDKIYFSGGAAARCVRE